MESLANSPKSHNFDVVSIFTFSNHAGSIFHQPHGLHLLLSAHKFIKLPDSHIAIETSFINSRAATVSGSKWPKCSEQSVVQRKITSMDCIKTLALFKKTRLHLLLTQSILARSVANGSFQTHKKISDFQESRVNKNKYAKKYNSASRLFFLHWTFTPRWAGLNRFLIVVNYW